MSTTTPTSFVKVTLQEPVLVTGPLQFAPCRTTLPITDPAYDRLVADGWTEVERWNVWTCQSCGMNDSDREHGLWEAEHYGPVTHLARYGHESVRPA